MADFDSLSLLSPCSSTSTIVPGKCFPAARPSAQPPLSEIKVMLPNLTETKTVEIADLERFVERYIGAGVAVTTLHLLVYLYAQNWTQHMTFVSDIKLLHMGKQYRLTRLMDLHSEHPSLVSVASRFPSFQLFVTPDQVSPAVTLPVQELMARSMAPKVPEEEIPVTYADAVIRMIRRASHRKSSVTSTTSSGTAASESGQVSRTSSTGSSVNPRKRSKIKHSWRKMVSCVTVSAR
ncbi:hypothetical protein FT663_03682 [Candidozyma haemuli var. vulneris]|uniref:Uncharacterized protein n=1 Tax=Candidozyma haemuli TaxID=45357 RepID=A0A2V1AS78_9ASCO|nr:hypothetical protein CXQ85_004466 [[Candida] haemuloni]KAF3987773.1 hypothetical protein FT662_03791 [[Candida] haemuloni var. vulneris]KAF3989260.1 hypothetical protein FT663_03682 [[Candida] haemuloni var. vulneris]PVH20950.1 hypothetical protein CXQ85_004466 [[Candida] haemuloni]